MRLVLLLHVATMVVVLTMEEDLTMVVDLTMVGSIMVGSTTEDLIMVDPMAIIMELVLQFAEDLSVSVGMDPMGTIVDHMDQDQVVTMVDYMEQVLMDTT